MISLIGTFEAVLSNSIRDPEVVSYAWVDPGPSNSANDILIRDGDDNKGLLVQRWMARVKIVIARSRRKEVSLGGGYGARHRSKFLDMSVTYTVARGEWLGEESG